MPTKQSLAIAVILGFACQLPARSAGATKPEVKACLTALETSYTFAKQQKLLEQRDQLLRCSQTQCPGVVRADCAQRVDNVNRAIPTIIFHVTDPAGNDLSSVRVTMDGTLFALQLTGASMPLNPGKHQFVFEVEGQAPAQKEFVILTAQKDRREDITVGTAVDQHSSTSPVEPVQHTEPNGAHAAVVPAVQAAAPPTENPAPSSRESSHGSAQKTWAIISGSVGIVGIGIGTALAVSAKHTASSANCDASNICSPDGANDRTAAIHRANWSMLPTGIGIAALGTGFVLWFVKPSSKREARPVAALSLSADKVSVTGRF